MPEATSFPQPDPYMKPVQIAPGVTAPAGVANDYIGDAGVDDEES